MNHPLRADLQTMMLGNRSQALNGGMGKLITHGYGLFKVGRRSKVHMTPVATAQPTWKNVAL
jgi:hypothetical protein